MSRLIFNDSAEPSSPASAKTLLHTDTTGRIRSKNAAGIYDNLSQSRPSNLIRNSGFWFAQRQAPATLTTYSNVGGRIITADGWGISNGTASTQFRRVDSSGAVETGLQSRFYGEFTKITSTGKMQIMQAIEGSDATQLRGRNVRVQMKLKTIVAASATWNIALVQLNSAGTLDTIPSTAATFFTAQGADTVDPTLGTNLAYIAPTTGKTGHNCTAGTNSYACTVTSAWTLFGGVFTVPTNCKNLIVLLYSHNGVAATNGVAIAEAIMVDNETVQDWFCDSSQVELARCQRQYQKTFAIDTAPVQNAGVTTGCLRCILGKTAATALAAQFQFQFSVPMRTTPGTITTYNPGAANAEVRQISGTATDLTATATANSTDRSVDITATGAATGVVGDQCGIHVTADSEL